MQNFSIDSWKTKFESYLVLAQNNLAYVGAGLAVVTTLAGGLYWHHYSSVKHEQAATVILADCLSHYEQVAQGKGQWSDVQTMARAGYDKFSNTNVAPYILSVEVDALLAEDKTQEALDRLNLMLSKIGTTSPLYGLFALKQALIKLDMPHLQESALQELENLVAHDQNNFSDAAQYYLALYLQSRESLNDQERARELWKKLAAINDTVTDSIGRSPWATMAQSKINGLA